ncbi:MAG: L-seryl-tRNA(Sec) selenium transferase [Actinomycetota bacterium]|nr:L-seryl-tRNA(Sec) selenium transferase [Actinomycetota bacterium]
MPPGDPELSRGLRELPGVDRVIAALGRDVPESVKATAARDAVSRARAAIVAGDAPPSFEEIVSTADGLLDEHRRRLLQGVINATGVLIHTNLGRVPLGERQLAAVTAIASGYSNLEYDLSSGRRGSRYTHARRLLIALTGAESALVVNNNAAAVLVVLAALCERREVIISRGELIEIGGEFRIPEVMSVSGARLLEVGTTNRTHLDDYERAITPETAAILKVHPSNYRIVGFTATVRGSDLARLARGRGVCFIHDLGSGLIEAPADPHWARKEPLVTPAIEEGADVVTFSGDKLLGGPQAGIILGRSELITKIERHPLMRALRVDKMTLAALEATLDAYLRGAHGELPLWALATASSEELEARTRRIANALQELAPEAVKVEATATEAVTGGGSLPGATVPSWAVAVTHPERATEDIARALRTGATPVVARVEDDRLLADLRCVPASQDEALLAALSDAIAGDDAGR